MVLVDYSSDNSNDDQVNTTSTNPQQGVSSRSANLGTKSQQNDSDNDDDQEDDYDPQDAFGINKLSSTTSTTAAVNSKSTSATTAGASTTVQSAPQVVINTSATSTGPSNSLITRPSDNVVFYNPSYTDMTRPVQGPQNPWNDRKLDKMNTITGHVEQQHYSDLDFKIQQRNFHVLGYAADPSMLHSASGTQAISGDTAAALARNMDLTGDMRPSRAQQKAIKRKRKAKGQLGVFQDSDEEEEEGTEAAGANDAQDAMVEQTQEDGSVVLVPAAKKAKKQKEQKEYIGPWAGWEGEHIGVVRPTEEEYEEQEEQGGAPLNKKQRKSVTKDTGPREVLFGEEKSVFHGKELHDYLGRSYLHIPTDVDVNLQPSEPGLQECFLPKKVIHTWSGHTKAVSKIQLFPTSGHLILSASMDTRIKLWDVYHEGKCLRTFMGHSKAVHDVTFDSTGKQFLSAGFDRQMKLWDAETGACKQAFSNGKIPYCIKFNPNNENIFLAGMSDKKIVQYDMRSGEIVQEYDQHLGPVNTITFVDENRRFVTSSDDKSMRVWDFDIPVAIKIIAEPSMHSMPAIGKHPNGKWLAAQSLDNQILLFSADTFKQNRKKRFAGHTAAGYACEPQFSPDGRYLSSGDSFGNLVLWDFKTSRIVSRIKAHQKALVSHAWLPHESSKVVTSSFDGTIKLLD